jgi:protein-L-isoaspartate(D-aspartate) O-methyltransferase
MTRIRLMLVGVILALGLCAAVCAGLESLWLARFRPEEQLPVPEAEPPELAPGVKPRAAKRPPAEDPNSPEAKARRRMVDQHLRARDITDSHVLEVMGRVGRHRFVPEDFRGQAYADHPLPIGHEQTISQPYIVALMTQLARPKPTDRALDIGTGSGYQAAVLAELCKEVYSIEILKPLADGARTRLEELGYDNVTVRCGDGYQGWPDKAPFDVIIVAAAPDHVPKPLVEQLAPGGRLVIPVGSFYQELLLLQKQTDGAVRQESVIPVRFVPMTGKAQEQ